MKKLLLLVMMMCAFTIAPASAKNVKTKSMDKTVKGCIHKDGDNIWLKTRSGSYHLMSKTDLSAHDGHEVKVTGLYSKGAMPNDNSGKAVKHLDISNVEMVSDHCAMGTKKMHKM